MTGALLAVETGGTKIVGRLAWNGGAVDARWPTGTPEDALRALGDFVDRTLPPGVPLMAAGLAAFGPLLIDASDPESGRMLGTPKPGWKDSNLRAALAARLGVEVGLDTDVNAAAMAERALGAGRGADSVAYVTVGTGIGAGLASSAGTLRGSMHPELGHLRLVRRPGDHVPSTCPFHDDCAEGLAAGPALARRLLDRRLDDEAARSVCAGYVAQLLVGVVLAWSPHRIVLGGGLGTSRGFIKLVRAAFADALGSYGVGDAARTTGFVVAPHLPDAGLAGALMLAQEISSNVRRPTDA